MLSSAPALDSIYLSLESLKIATVGVFSLAAGTVRAGPHATSYPRGRGFGMEVWNHPGKSQTLEGTQSVADSSLLVDSVFANPSTP